MCRVSLTLGWIVATAVAIVYADTEESQCCPPNQAITKKNNKTDFYCLNPATKTITPLPLQCDSELLPLRPADNFDFHVNSNGELVLDQPNFEVTHSGNFCIGNYAPRRNMSRAYRMAILCNTYEEEVRVIEDEVYGFCMVFSTILLLITAAIYIALPELRDIQGKSIINFCLSLGIGLGILAAMKLIPYSDMNLCAARGFLVYFFIIASFFWMNAISVQILFSIRRPLVIIYGWKEFIYYALYAWGSSAMLTIAMAIVNFTPGKHLKPGIGLNHCWFFDKKQQWYYMYSVMTILITLNIFIFFYIACHICRNTFSSNHVKALRYKFMMTFRMSIVMGVAWIFEMIGSLAKTHILWDIMDLLNSLQGVLIFLVVVVFRRRVIKAMYKHGWLQCISGSVERYLAVGEDEEDVVEHTIGVNMDDKQNNKQ